MSSVSKTIRVVISESRLDNPDAWVDEVVKRTSDHTAALRELVRARVSAEASSLRRMTETPAARGTFGSAKVQGIREDFWPEFLRQVIVGVDGYVRLADATADDLEAAAARNDAQAAALVVNANRFRTLASAMQKQGVGRLGDLAPMSREELAA